MLEGGEIQSLSLVMMRSLLTLVMLNINGSELLDRGMKQVGNVRVEIVRMNGVEAARLMKEQWQEIAIIGLCVALDTSITDAFMKAGALAVVSKDQVAHLYSTANCQMIIAAGQATRPQRRRGIVSMYRL